MTPRTKYASNYRAGVIEGNFTDEESEQDKSTSSHTKDTEKDSESSNQSSSDKHTAFTSKETEESQPLPPHKFYFSHTIFHEVPTITARCDPGKTVRYLKKLLSKQEKRWFISHPQFKHIWDMYMEPNRKLMGMWVLLLRTACTKKKKVAWFVVNGFPIRYSLREHGLICGLDCHEYPPAYKKEKLGSYDFVTRIFGKKRVEVAEVKKKLDSMKGPEDGDRLQVVVLYFLSKIIRGTKKVVRGSIDKFILQIVNDLEDCKSFPWGRMTFDDSLEAIEDLVHKSGGEVKSYMTLPCFIILLETLIFECIPDLCRRYRDDVQDAKESCPRMCRKRFKACGMKGFPLQKINKALRTIKNIKSCLQPENEEESRLMLCLLDRVPDDETDNVDLIVDNINKHVESGKKQIWWENLFKLDVAGRGVVKEVVEQHEQQNVQFGGAEAEHQQQQSDQGGEGGMEKQQNTQFAVDASGFKALAEMMDAGFKEMKQMFQGLERRMTVVEGRCGLGGRDDMTGWDERTSWNPSQDENPMVADDGEKEKGDDERKEETEVLAGDEEREEENEVLAGDGDREEENAPAGDEEREEENEVLAGDGDREEENAPAGNEDREEENEVLAGDADREEENAPAGNEDREEENEVLSGDGEREEENAPAGNEDREEENEVMAGDGEREEEDELMAEENMERAMVLFTGELFTEDEGEGSKKRKFAEKDEREGPTKKKASPRKKTIVPGQTRTSLRTVNPSQFCRSPWTKRNKRKT